MLTFDKCEPQEWHCTLRGPAGTDFEGGLYHFRIRLPAEYPFRPPSIMLLTPNGRFELSTKVKRIYLVILVGYHALTQTFLVRSVSASPTVRGLSLTEHTLFR